MSINNRNDYIADLAEDGLFVTDHLYFGSNLAIPPGTFTPNWDTGEVDSVTFVGTAGGDTLIGGGGEYPAFFLGTRGNDLYGVHLTEDGDFTLGVVDYSGARRPVVVDMDYRGSRTFTDASGQTQTVSIMGRALKDGFGGHDDFMEATAFGGGFSSVSTVIGSRFADTMVGESFDLFGGGGNDCLRGNALHGGDGDDVLKGSSPYGSSVALFGDAGNDLIFGTDGPGRADVYLRGGEGNDHIFAGAGDDTTLTGDAGNDFIDAGAGNDFVDGGVGKDVIASGSGNDIINPDAEYFQSDPNQARDGAKDIIRVTRADLGDYTDVVLSRAFEAGRDEIRFKDAVCGGVDYRIFTEAQSFNDTTGRLLLSQDLADRPNTVLQIDQDHNGFGRDDYLLVVVDATLSQHGYLLT